MAQTPKNPKDVSIPGIVGGFNIPKAVIENKVDILTFLEFMVRKELITAQELDEVRADVVAHLNAAYPELALSYTTPDELKPSTKAPVKPASSIAAAAMAKPAPKADAPPVSSATANLPPDSVVVDGSEDPIAAANKMKSQPVASPNAPLYHEAPRPKFIQ